MQTQKTNNAINHPRELIAEPSRAGRKRRGKIVPLNIARDPETLRHPVCLVLARILYDARLTWGFSRYELGTLAGVSPGMIKKIERGICVPTVEVLVRLCTALRVCLGDLFGEVDCTWPQYVQIGATIVR